MPLSPPAQPREALHLRTYEFRGFRRADGLFELEGRIVDTKGYGFDNEERGHIAPGTPVHDMSIRLGLDDTLTVTEIEASTDASPFSICPGILPNFQRMIGVRVGFGWRKAIRERLGGAEGCTHLVEMLIAMATPAYQTIYPILARERKVARRGSGEEGTVERAWPGLVNSCHAYAADSPVVKRLFPDRAGDGD